MTFDAADLRLLGALASLVRRANPIPVRAMAEAEAVGLRLAGQEPRLAAREMDLAWLMP